MQLKVLLLAFFAAIEDNVTVFARDTTILVAHLTDFEYLDVLFLSDELVRQFTLVIIGIWIGPEFEKELGNLFVASHSCEMQSCILL